MWTYNDGTDIRHWGIKGMRWGYNDNVRNGNRVAGEGKKTLEDYLTEQVNNNIYITSASDYSQKSEKIKETDEWKAIVARKDPEYVYTDENGKEQYRFDDYLVKKKHPELDILDDVANYREVSINKVTVKSLTAGLADYAKTAVQAAAVVSRALLEKFKYSQGSYAEKEKEFSKTLKTGVNSVITILNNASKYSEQAADYTNKSDIEKLASDAAVIGIKAASKYAKKK